MSGIELANIIIAPKLKLWGLFAETVEVKSLKVFSETEMGRDVYIQIGAFGLVEALSVMVVDDGETDDIVPDSLMLKNIVDVINDKNAGNWRDDIPDEWSIEDRAYSHVLKLDAYKINIRPEYRMKKIWNATCVIAMDWYPHIKSLFKACRVPDP